VDLTKAADEFSKLVASRVQFRRLGLGMSKLALAGAAGLDQRAITFVETGARVPSIATLYRIATALETSVEELVKAPKPAKNVRLK
jgi:transcriptional regulator with XRE-family HTH domain